MDDNVEQPDLTESVQELKTKLEAMRRMMNNGDMREGQMRNRRNGSNCKPSIIDGNFLSMVFVTVLIVIITVTFYAFFNLFSAVKKKYTGPHSEL